MNAERKRMLTAALPLVLLLALPSHAGAVEQKLIAPGAQLNDDYGSSVAVDGDTAVVGADGVDGGRGAVYVFARSGDTWTQTAKLTASDRAADDDLGWAVAIDGDTIVASAPLDNAGSNVDQGAVYTFSRTGPSDRTETAKLTASYGSAGDELGFSVAIDGDTIVAGAPYQNNLFVSDQGVAYTFARAGGVARTETARLLASDGAAGDLLGWSVAIDGDTIVAGAVSDDIGPNANAGSAYAFSRTGTATRTETAKLSTVLPAANDQVGRSVAIGGDTIAVGAPYRDTVTNTDQGVVYTFDRTGTAQRTPTAGLTASDGAASDNLGGSLAMDEDMILAGASGDDVGSTVDQGSAYSFTRAGAGGRNETGKLIASDGAPGDFLGASVAVAGDTLMAGAPLDDIGADGNEGSASIFFTPAPTGDGSGTGTGTGPGSDVTAPVLSRLRVSPAHLRQRGHITFRLSEPASVRFTVQRVTRRRGHARYATLRGSFTRTGTQGANRLRLTGRIGHRALRPGRYRLIAMPTDSAGNTGNRRAARFVRERLFRRSSRH